MRNVVNRKWEVIFVIITYLFLFGCSSLVGVVTEEPIQENLGKRSWGSAIDDNTIETITEVNINKADSEFTNNHVSVTSFNGIVLLTGQVTSERLKNLAEDVTKKVHNIREIYNELEIAGPTTLLSRSGDTWLTTKIKTQMLTEPNFPSSRIKVITENGTVYLMGIVTPNEAQTAVELVKSSYGVQKIVKVFEYLKSTSY